MDHTLEEAEAEIARLTAENARLLARIAELSPPVAPADNLDATITLHYRDSGGKTTERAVKAHQMLGLSDGRPTALKCYCHLRKMARIFALDRITRVVDAGTGEVITDLAAFLRAGR